MAGRFWNVLFILVCRFPEGPTLVMTFRQYDASLIPEYPRDHKIKTILKDWPLYLSRYCGYVCYNGSLIERSRSNEEFCPEPDCYPCDCGKYCSVTGTCCPTVDESGSIVSYDLESSVPVPDYLEGIFQRVNCNNLIASTNHRHLSVSTCSNDWTEASVKDRCENPDGKSEKSLVPYIDEDSGIVFENIFCVHCNGFYHDDSDIIGDRTNFTLVGNDPRKLKALEINVLCPTYLNILSATSNAELIEALSYNGCERWILIEPRKCPSWISSLRDTNFNLTFSSTGDERMKKLCFDLPPLPALRIEGKKNLFCHLYEGGRATDISCGGLMGNPSSSFTLLWKVSKTEHRKLTETGKCAAGQWEVDKGQCISSLCSEGKILNEIGNNCQAALSNRYSLDYSLNIILGTNANESRLMIYADNIRFVGDYVALKLNMYYDIQYKIYVSYVKSCHNKNEIDVIAEIYTGGFNGRDEFEVAIVNLLTRSIWEIFEVTLYPICVGTELCRLYRSDTRQTCTIDKSTQYFEKGVILGFVFSAIDFIPSLTCPYAELIPIGTPQIDDNTSTIYFTIYLRHQEVRIEWNPNVSFVNGRLHVCMGYFQDLYLKTETYVTATPRYTLNVILMMNYYLDIVCVSVSCVLLLATIVTYLLFPSLRTTPGLNTLCLCASLLPANLSLLVTSLAGTRVLLPKPYCLFHAIFLHYSWIASFVWMNTCCIHMYRVFTGHRTGSKKKHFLWYCLYSFGSPCIVVMLVVIITYTTTDGASIGYSMEICFLDTSVSVFIIILGILVPLCVTVLINSVLFSLTVKEMFSIKKMQQQTKSRHGVGTYAKLSTVTGLFCLLSAAGAQFDDVIFSLLSSPLSALQGLFVFVSFMANKKIYGMYYQLVFNRGENPTKTR